MCLPRVFTQHIGLNGSNRLAELREEGYGPPLFFLLRLLCGTIPVMPDWVVELSKLQTPFVVAGGAMLNLVVFGDDAVSDVDIFSPNPEHILKELGVNTQRNGTVYRAGSVDFVEFPQETDDYVADVIGAFDFNVTTCAWNGKIEDDVILCASDYFINGISTGTLELLPHVDPWRSPTRTAHRAGKYMNRLSFYLGPRLEAFLKKYVNNMTFALTPGRVFEKGQPLPYNEVSLTELRKLVKTVNGPSHPLCLLDRNK